MRQGGSGGIAGQAIRLTLDEGGIGGDAALVAAARSGDAAAFGELYERHRDAVYRFCLARTGSAHEAEDLTSEVFVKALRAIARYQERGVPFVSYLYRIARNAAIDRSRSRRPTLPVEDAASLDSGQDVEREAIQGTDRATLLAALARLKPDHREVLVLRFVEGLSGPEAALMLGRTEGAVRILQHRAMQRLRCAFAEVEAEAGGGGRR